MKLELRLKFRVFGFKIDLFNLNSEPYPSPRRRSNFYVSWLNKQSVWTKIAHLIPIQHFELWNKVSWLSKQVLEKLVTLCPSCEQVLLFSLKIIHFDHKLESFCITSKVASWLQPLFFWSKIRNFIRYKWEIYVYDSKSVTFYATIKNEYFYFLLIFCHFTQNYIINSQNYKGIPSIFNLWYNFNIHFFSKL